MGNGVRNFVRSPAIRPRSTGIARLIRRIVGDLRLVEVHSAGIAIPKHLKLLVMFDQQAVNGDVVSVDHESVRAGIAGPAYAVAVVGTPYPGVVDDHVVAIDAQVLLRAAHSGPANAEKHIVQNDRILFMTRRASLWPDLQQNRRDLGTCVKENAGDVDSVHVGDGDGRSAMDRAERRETQTEHYSVRTLDANGFDQVVDTRRQEQVFSSGQ